MTEPSNTILIAGIGNIFLGDDAFGSMVARQLMQRALPADVCVVDFGIRGIDLAYALMDGYRASILIDAMPRGGKPGSLYLVEPETDREDTTPQLLQLHSLDPAKVFGMVESFGGETGRVLVIGCEPTTVSEGDSIDELSPAVAEAVAPAIDMTLSVVDCIRRGISLNENKDLNRTYEVIS